MKPKKTYHFISHTHWDREWYLPFEQFRYQLVQLIDRLLNLLDKDPEFKYFHLDGQTIVLEDYYAIRPENKERLEAYIHSGRILVGPWYQQNDLFLTSAESTVRNLIEGIDISRKLGGEMKVGYLPDHFGLIGQMPQIFSEVGLNNTVFGRGMDYASHKEKGPFFYWKSPDGSTITGHLMYHWYNNAQRLPNDIEALQSVFHGMREREEAVNASPHYSMMNGVDHLEAQYDLSEVIDKLNQLYGDEINVVHDTLPSFVTHVQDYMKTQSIDSFETIEGELREAFEYSILAGTLSSRVYIKKANLECHDLLEKWIEPLSAWCKAIDLDAYDAGMLKYLWKLYMENHPHDSICGCSQDEVHEHMMDRYQRLREAAEVIIQWKLTVLARQIENKDFDLADQKLLVVNTSQQDSNAVQHTAVYFMQDDQVEDFAIENSQGHMIPYRIVSKRPSRKQVNSPINLPGVLSVTRYDIEWKPEAPALGYLTYRVKPHVKGQQLVDQEIQIEKLPVLVNPHVKIELQSNGSFHIEDKATGKQYKAQGRLEDAGDRGDLYVFKDTEGARQRELWDGDVKFTSYISNELYDECTYTFVWQLPSELNLDRKTRSDTNISNALKVTLRLDRNASQVNMTIQMDNRSKDHRIRVLFPMEETAKYVLAGGQFDVVRRSWDSGKQYQRDANAQAFWKWVAPVAEDRGIAVYAKGLHEYEMTEEGKTTGVTIVRCVENINVREVVYLEEDYQPKGQCLGLQTVELAIRPFSKESATKLYQEAERFHQGLKIKAFPIDERRWSKGRSWVQDTAHDGMFVEEDPNEQKPKLPLKGTFLNLQGEAMLSAYKWSEDGKAPVLRMYNVEEQEEEIVYTKEDTEADAKQNSLEQVNLLEEFKENINLREGKAVIRVAAKKIVTVKG